MSERQVSGGTLPAETEREDREEPALNFGAAPHPQNPELVSMLVVTPTCQFTFVWPLAAIDNVIGIIQKAKRDGMAKQPRVFVPELSPILITR